MKLMLRSQANLLLSISRVTEINKGRKTAGIDGQKVLTNLGREKLYKEMRIFSPWKAKPVKRVLYEIRLISSRIMATINLT